MKSKLFCILLVIIICGCAKNENSPDGNSSQTLTVSAAISLKDAFDEIGKAFETKSGRKINFSYGASGALQKQIENGAPVDIFASAGTKQMDELEKHGFIDASSRRDFTENSLVLIVSKNSNADIKIFSDLTKPEIEKIAVGNPKTVPAGQYAEESLLKMKLQNDLQNKFIFAENVRQVLDYVARGEVDAGIVYATDAFAAKDGVHFAAIASEKSHSPILYPLAIIKDSKNKKLTREFADFVLSGEGQNILKKFGFKGVTEK